MMLQNILVFLCVLLISLSGSIINGLKKGQSGQVMSYRDQGTLRWFRILVLSALAGSVLFYGLGFPAFKLSDYGQYIAALFVLAGLLIRWKAVMQLGDAFTTRVALVNNHKLHTKGLFRLIRHPSYTGLLLYYAGLGVLMTNWVALLLLIVLPAIAVWQRIRIEEKVLLQYFGMEYSNYRRKSWYLFPYIF